MALTTAEQLLRAGDIGRCELVRGELRMMIPAGGEHGRITAHLTCLLGNHVRSKQLGTFYAAETGFVLDRDPDTVRAPDFAFIGAARAVRTDRGFVPGAPDLAVEVLSPDDRPGSVSEKVSEWLEVGSVAVWVVDSRKRTVTIHEIDRPSATLTEADTLDGGELLPGLELSVDQIFA